MRKLDQSPYESACPELFEQYSATSAIGVNLRRGDARLRIQEMLDAESTVREQEHLQCEITDRIERLRQQHDLNMQYLIEFGVLACERNLFQEILQRVAVEGGLSLREAADLAHSQYRDSPLELTVNI